MSRVSWTIFSTFGRAGEAVSGPALVRLIATAWRRGYATREDIDAAMRFGCRWLATYPGSSVCVGV